MILLLDSLGEYIPGSLVSADLLVSAMVLGATVPNCSAVGYSSLHSTLVAIRVDGGMISFDRYEDYGGALTSLCSLILTAPMETLVLWMDMDVLGTQALALIRARIKGAIPCGAVICVR